ncbi:MAG: hypothetical protein K8R53_04030 [Bacteroidales bacterium]|nr:hypothetical protein [Bacteroidales bacterium]
MDSSQRKKWKQRKRDYIRQEKESVRREKKQLRKKLRKARKRLIIGYFNYLVGKFTFKKDGKPEENLDSGKKKQQRLKRKRYFSEERKSRKRERAERKKKLKPMRKRIRRERYRYFIRRLKEFIKNPIPKRKLSRSQRLIMREARKQRRQHTLKQFTSFPRRFTQSVGRFWKKRLKWIRLGVIHTGIFLANFRDVLKVRNLRSVYVKVGINSTVYFLFSFLILYYMYQLVTIYTASFFDIPAVLFSYRIYWPLYTYSTLYTRAALIVIFGTGPLACIILGLIFYRLYLWLRNRLAYTKMLFVWLAIHAFNLFFGAYIVGVITRTGFIYTSEWLFLSNVFDVEEIVLLIISIIVLIIIGYFGTRHILTASTSNSAIEPKFRVFYLIFQVLIPWLLGTTILYFMNAPNNPSELLLQYASSLLIIVPVLVNYNSLSFQKLKIVKTPRKTKIRWIFLILLGALIILIKMTLTGGLSFG